MVCHVARITEVKFNCGSSYWSCYLTSRMSDASRGMDQAVNSDLLIQTRWPGAGESGRVNQTWIMTSWVELCVTTMTRISWRRLQHTHTWTQLSFKFYIFVHSIVVSFELAIASVDFGFINWNTAMLIGVFVLCVWTKCTLLGITDVSIIREFAV